MNKTQKLIDASLKQLGKGSQSIKSDAKETKDLISLWPGLTRYEPGTKSDMI